MTDRIETDIAIVGAGIAGPALAAGLADSGLRVTVIEMDTQPPDTARGDHLQSAVCEILEQWRVLDALWARGAEKRLGTRWLDAGGREVVHVRFDNLPVRHPYFLFLRHELISEALLGRAAANPEFSFLRPATARLLEHENGLYGLKVETADGAVEIDAACIVAADGRGSRLRKAADFAEESYAYRNPLLVFFAERPVADPRNDLEAWLTPSGVISLIPRNGNHWKIGFPAAREDIAEWNKASPDELGERLGKLVPALADCNPQLAGVYPVKMLTARHWSDRNLALLGDACHAMHPGRSQGMNASIKVASRLARRLADAGPRLVPGAIPALLDEFDAEVRPALTPRLAENHKRGLELDSLDPATTAALGDMLAGLSKNPEKLRAYAMNMAGY